MELETGLIITALTVFALSLAGWVTHIVTTLAAKAWLFMIVGALIPPVAVVHGWSQWLGYNWLV